MGRMRSPALVPLGDSGLQVSRLGFGLAAVGRPAYINLGRAVGSDRSRDAMRRAAGALLDEAYAHGVRYFDAARSYGDAEAFLAEWLQQRDPPDVVVGSKWGYRYVGGWQVEAERHEIKDHSRAALDRQWEESRHLLGDRLSLYQIHSATPDSGVLEDGQVIERLLEIADQGVVVGLSVSGPAQAETVGRALAVECHGRNPFGAVQATWNLLETSVGPALATAHARGWGVVVKEALANGRLATTGEQGPLASLAGDAGVSADVVALAAALAQPWADVVLSGASTTRQLRSNLRAADLTLDQVSLERLGTLREEAGSYWAHRARLPWR